MWNANEYTGEKYLKCVHTSMGEIALLYATYFVSNQSYIRTDIANSNLILLSKHTLESHRVYTN